MKFFKNMLKGLHKFNLADYGVYELTIMAGVLLLAKYFPVLLEVNQWVYAAMVAVGMVHILNRLFGRK